MKLFSGILKKTFSTKRYIKPRHTQQYFDNAVINRYSDRMNHRKRRNMELIFPNEIYHPDKNLPEQLGEDSNNTYYDKLRRFQEQVKGRLRSHTKLVETTLKDTNFLESDKKYKTTENFTSNYLDEDTGLLYGLGFDKFIHKINKDKQDVLSQDNKIDILINKLGFVDLRDFIALNRYILEGKQHEDSIIQTKTKFLEDALIKFNKKKRDEVKNKFSLIDTKNDAPENKIDDKVEYLLNNFGEVKNLFYENYYKIREMSQREFYRALNDFEKYEILRETKGSDNKSLANLYNDDEIDLNQTGSEKKSNEESYLDHIIHKYRESRTLSIKITSGEIKSKIDSFIRLNELNDNSLTFLIKDIFSIIKFYTFFQKYKKLYIPTNLETERLILKYFKENAIKNINFESVQLNDPFFTPLLKDFISDIKDFQIVDEESKEKYIEWDRLKKIYFEAKFEHEKKKVLENVDNKVAADLGYVVLESLNQKKLNNVSDRGDAYMNEVFRGSRLNEKMSLVENIVDKHYKSYKLDYMYNYLDFFSNKYKIRRKIAQEMKNRVSIHEINELLEKLCENKVDSPKSRRTFSVSDIVNNKSRKIVPDFMDILKNQNTNSLIEKEMKNAAEDIERDLSKIPLELNNYDRFEIDAYKGVKNDPFFKHYLKTHLSYFLETYNESTLNTPFYTRGFKKADYIRWQQITIPQLDSKSKSSVVVKKKSGSLENEIYEKVMNDFGDISRFTNMTESQRIPINGCYFGTGKRKKARAVAYIKPGTGNVIINGKPAHKYMSDTVYRGKLYAPLVMTGNAANLDVKLYIFGGGISGQMDAAVPAISKALAQMNPDYVEILAKSFFLTHDPRNVEPKKPGRIKARKGYVYNRR